MKILSGRCAQYAASLGEIVNVIHAAGVSPANTTAKEILRINAMGPIYITEHFRPLLAEGGVLMLFSSTAGYMFETNEADGDAAAAPPPSCLPHGRSRASQRS